MTEPTIIRADLVERIARGMFDCYRGYNAETQQMMWLREKYQLERQAERALAAIHDAGCAVVPGEASAVSLTPWWWATGDHRGPVARDAYRFMVAAADLAKET